MISTFSSAVSVGTRLKNWNTKPTRSRRYAVRCLAFSVPMSSPAIRIRPAVGSSIPPTRFSSVVFPEPDGPSSTTNSPGQISRSTSLSAWTDDRAGAVRPADSVEPQRGMSRGGRSLGHRREVGR